MPSLKDLRRELKRLRVSSGEIQLPGGLYDELLGQAEEIVESDEDELETEVED